ncbi:alpha/beta fold hydrolase [Rhodococcus sp. IEGM 1379]|uniref:alpha/beta fold hydrolase n=1 Tax=Rhodococcus sp. IEGM 1379 TaxID=3047086 RepID=UPI0024B7B914|nr:alpha/beta fold hydrolase [Rhodococcus sp. IEGM 1379]MDI9916557.1 alpha/beta fold hydrolase [Rhodococcus sp. IEGM 1379]
MTEFTAESLKFDGGAGPIAADKWSPASTGNTRGTVLMLHGGGQTRHSWDRAAKILAHEGWVVYTLDARGHGDSAWDAEGDYTVDALAQDLRLVIDQISATEGRTVRPVLFGASMGGMTGMVAEGEYPGLCRALVLVDITPKVRPDGLARIHDFMRGSPNGFANLEEAADAVAAYQPHRTRPKNIEGLRRNVREGSDGRLYWHWDPAFTRLGANLDKPQDNHDRLTAAANHIAVPTLLVYGAESDIVGADGIDELLALIPPARAVAVAAAGHMVAGDDNAVFVQAVSGFLDELGS